MQISYTYMRIYINNTVSTISIGVNAPSLIFDLHGSINVFDPRNNSHAITRTKHYFSKYN